MDITKGEIGNALTSTAADHIVAVANDIYDETQQKYQSTINNEKANKTDVYTKNEVNTELLKKENKTNKTNTINSSSTDDQYPSAKAVQTELTKRDTEITNIKDHFYETIYRKVTRTYNIKYGSGGFCTSDPIPLKQGETILNYSVQLNGSAYVGVQEYITIDNRNIRLSDLSYVVQADQNSYLYIGDCQPTDTGVLTLELYAKYEITLKEYLQTILPTKQDVSDKVINLDEADNVTYPTSKAVKDYVDGRHVAMAEEDFDESTAEEGIIYMLY